MREGIKKHQNLVENFFYLYVSKITNILIPLVTLPYLVRVLGIENYGLISFAQVFALLFVVFVDFGFDLSIVRIISINSDNIKKVSEIFNSVIVIKILLILISFTFYYFIINYFDKFSKDELLYLYMYGIVIGQGLFPLWFFQGMQQMKYITILNFAVKVIFLILVFLLVKTEDDYINYPILFSLSYIIVLPFAFYTIKTKFNVDFFIPSIEKLIYYTKYSSHFFASRVALRFYEGGGLFVVGLVSSDLIAGYYAIADQLRAAITSLYSPISQALYPYISKEKNIKLYKKMFYAINIVNIFGLVILFVFTEDILDLLFGSHSFMTVSLIRIFVFVMAMDVPSILVGYPLLGAFGYTHFVNYSLVITAVIYFILLTIMYLFGLVSAKTVAFLYLFTIAIELGLRVYGVVKYKVWRNNV